MTRMEEITNEQEVGKRRKVYWYSEKLLNVTEDREVGTVHTWEGLYEKQKRRKNGRGSVKKE